MHNRTRLRGAGRFLAGAALLVLLDGGAGSASRATPLDCTDIDHDCRAEKAVSKAVKKAGKALRKCAASGISPCDLTQELAGISSPTCRTAVECQLLSLLATSGGGTTACSEGLFVEGYKAIADTVTDLRKDRRAQIPGETAACVTSAAASCSNPVSPILAGDCAGVTAPAAAADCVCGEAADLTNLMMLTPATCKLPPAPPPAPYGSVGKTPKGPSFVIVLTDDQRWDAVGPVHSVDGATPVMPIVTSELADSGVTFEQYFVTTPLCCPSRTSFLTGQYSHNTGIIENFAPAGGATLFDDTSTIATWLHDAGYTTAWYGKYLNDYAALGACIPPGWDEWGVFLSPGYFGYEMNENGTIVSHGSNPSDYSTDVIFAKAAAFIATAKQPFFLVVAPNAPHAPQIPAPRHAGSFASVAPWRPASVGEPNVSDKPAWVQALNWTAGDQSFVDTLRRDVLETLQAVDEGVGSLMQALRGAGLDGKTLVAFSSDNGFAWGEHRWSAKNCPYEECIRDPLIIRYPPAGTAPRVESGLVTNVDLASTLADLAGVVPPAPVNGVSLVPLIEGASGSWRTEILGEHWLGNVPEFGLVRETQWKYIEYVTGEQELYDLFADPLELVNLAADPAQAGRVATMSAKLHALQAQ